MRAETYRTMFTAMVWRIALVSVLPLLAIGGANFYLFYNLNREIVASQHSTALSQHRQSIVSFLEELESTLGVVAGQYPLERLLGGELERLFTVIQHRANVFIDIGVIDAEGRHLKYVGPYDLSGRNYRGTEWFRQVVERGVFISDVFLGFRGVPHFVIAVKRQEGPTFWILRATVNTDHFSKLVDMARIGRTGETFIVNQAGLYQTETRAGSQLLGTAEHHEPTPHPGIRVRELEVNDTWYLYTTTWLDNPRWLLTYRQEMAEVYQPLRKASIVGVLMFLLGAAAAVGLAVVVARQQVRRVVRADREKEALTQKSLIAGRTAAVGEMSAGLAHEIHNPLATIDTLQTWIRDLSVGGSISEEDRLEIVESAKKIGEQVERCKTITHGLLKFSRRVESRPEPTDLNQMLTDLAVIERARARVENVELVADLEPVPPVLAAPAHLQQIFANLVNNAIDACTQRPAGKVTIRSRREAKGVRVEVEDTGQGIPPENLSRIFVPFFTTKPVGRGTGLGLAICYGLVHDLGGTINVESQVGVGTTFTVHLPVEEQPQTGRAEPGAAR